MQQHLNSCSAIPTHVRSKIEELYGANKSERLQKPFWTSSAKHLGLVDTPLGIRFSRDPHEPLLEEDNTEEESDDHVHASNGDLAANTSAPQAAAVATVVPSVEMASSVGYMSSGMGRRKVAKRTWPPVFKAAANERTFGESDRPKKGRHMGTK
jgi:hypothetical protein